jgi:hypothetical protein
MNPENIGNPIPGQPIDPYDPDSEIYYPAYAYVTFPSTLPGWSYEDGQMLQVWFDVTSISSDVLGLTMNSGDIYVSLPYSNLKTVEDDAFALSYPDPSAPLTVTISSLPGSLEYFGYQSTPVTFGCPEFDSQGVQYQDGWVVGFDQSQAYPQGGSPSTRRQISLVNAFGIVGGAFENNTYIQSVILPSTLKAIPTKAFAGCTSLGMASGKRTITIPATVELIGDSAFLNNSNVTNFIFEGDAPNVSYNAFDGVGSSVLNLKTGNSPPRPSMPEPPAGVRKGQSGTGSASHTPPRRRPTRSPGATRSTHFSPRKSGPSDTVRRMRT